MAVDSFLKISSNCAFGWCRARGFVELESYGAIGRAEGKKGRSGREESGYGRRSEASGTGTDRGRTRTRGVRRGLSRYIDGRWGGLGVSGTSSVAKVTRRGAEREPRCIAQGRGMREEGGGR